MRALLVMALVVAGCASDCPDPSGVYTVTVGQTGGDCDGSDLEALSGTTAEPGNLAPEGCTLGSMDINTCETERSMVCLATCDGAPCLAFYGIRQIDTSGDGSRIEATWDETLRLGTDGMGGLYCAATYAVSYDRLIR